MRVNSSTCVSFDPEAIEDLYTAFLIAWNFIKMSDAASYLDEGDTQASLAQHIIAVACSGETKVLRVANIAIARFWNEKNQFGNAPVCGDLLQLSNDSNLSDDFCPRRLPNGYIWRPIGQSCRLGTFSYEKVP